MVPLAAQLNATNDIGNLNIDINAQVNKWVNYILDNQLPSGWLGPDDGFGGSGNTYVDLSATPSPSHCSPLLLSGSTV